MTSCLVLGNAVVYDILISLMKEEILQLQGQLADSLREFSVGDERKYQIPSSVSARPNGDRTLFRPFTSPTSVGVKIMVTPMGAVSNNDSNDDGKAQSAGRDAQKPERRPLKGIVALCDNEGTPTGVIDGKEITGYRTSLNALIGYVRRRNTTNIVVFGAGKCAIWHIRLALALRGSEIEQITVVNRSRDTAMAMIDQVQKENGKYWKVNTTLRYFEPDENVYDQALQQLLSTADVIFCTVLSRKVLFPAGYVTKSGRRPYVSAVGSWQPDMIELDPVLLNYVVDSAEVQNPFGQKGGMIVVDDREKIVEETGEGIQSKIKAENFVEWGQILDLEDRFGAQTSSLDYEQLITWLRDGLVVYKSIGVSVTDLVTGNFLLSIAKKRNLGVSVPDF